MTVMQRIEEIRDSRWFSNLTTFIIIAYASVLGFKTMGEVETNYALFLRVADVFCYYLFYF